MPSRKALTTVYSCGTCIKGREDDSAAKVLSLKAPGPEFSPEYMKGSRHGVHTCDLSAGETETGRSLGHGVEPD